MGKEIKKIILTDKQKNCVSFKPEGSLLVRGVPGAGKTTILLERARFLKEKEAEAGQPSPVIFLTYSRPLTTFVRQLSLKTHEIPVEVSTFHAWGSALLRDLGLLRLRFVDKKEEVVRHALNTVLRHKQGVRFPGIEEDERKQRRALEKFLTEEISWIKGQGIKSRDEYMEVKRSGRGNTIRVTATHKSAIYDVFEKYQELLKNIYRSVDYDDVAILLDQHIDRIPEDQRPAHILLDEAQDLSPLQLKVMKKLARVSYTIGADKGQQIYRRNFSWKELGIEVKGARSKFLDETFRSTVQIIELANSLQKHDELLLKDEDYVKASVPQNQGPKPVLYRLENREKEVEVGVQEASSLLSRFPDHTIGIIGYSGKELKKFADALELKKIPWIMVKDNEADLLSSGVKLVSYYSCKGLEFDHVIATGLKEGHLPSKHIQPGEEEEEFLTRERRKFYVALTRAKLTLTILSPRKYSRFIEELDRNLYDEK